MSVLSRYYTNTSDFFSSILNDIPEFKRSYYLLKRGMTPYDSRTKLVSINDNLLKLEVELAGFSKDQIEVFSENGRLVISAKDKSENSTRTFCRSWEISDTEKVGKITYVNGLLSVEIERIQPEAPKRNIYRIE
jgi:HSP20 family molecular chaperone IbpA